MFDSLPYFKNEAKNDLNRVDSVIREQVSSDVAIIEEIGHYIVGSGGKRLRPITTILSGKSLGCDTDELYRQAAMVEFIHTSTLLHDDVVDESEMRRGRHTANTIFGNAAAVLVGDFLYTRAFQLMVHPMDMRIMRVMADATNSIAVGEVMQLMNIGQTDLTEADYLRVIERKTAKLFEAASHIGAILAGASDVEEKALAEYGLYMGTAFQIIDDVLDYSGHIDNIGKNVGDDLAEGKATLPLIWLMQNGDKHAASTVKKALEEADRAYFTEIHELVMQSDALAYCHQQAEATALKAVHALKPLHQNEYTDTLSDLVMLSLNRIS